MNYYQTLGVPNTASADDIKTAYRKLASINHPDKGGDTATFQQIQAAYAVLSDPVKKAEYDAPQHPSLGPFNFGQGGHGDMHAFMREAMRQQMNQPQLFRTSVWVTLEQVLKGGNQGLQLQTHLGAHTINIDIPKGIQDGGQLRIDNALPGAILIVEFKTQPDLKFTRSGQNLECNHPVSILDLITGSTFNFISLSGSTLEVTIPPNTQPNKQLKLAGYGLPIPNSTSYGDQIIYIKPFVPTNIPDQIIDAIKAFQIASN